MRFTRLIVLILLTSSLAHAQETPTNWYSEATTNRITIQNSFPKGGQYSGTTKEHYNYSYLVFYSRIVNDSGKSITINIDFTAEPIPIPNAPNTFMKLFLPEDEMTLEKHSLFSYGITELKSLDEPTCFQKTLKNKEECLFYVVAVFYQTASYIQYENRGGNRAEFILEGEALNFSMLPQVESLHCGSIVFEK